MRKRIILISLVLLLFITGCENNKEQNKSKIVENDEMLSYTIDGEKTDIKPTKEAGYIVNKIICDNGTDMMWDNDNWEVELTKINRKDRCKIDFTKDIFKEGYRITVTSNMASALDSLSKATTLNGTVIIYSTSKIESVNECSGIIEDNKVIIRNVISNQTCNVSVEDKTLVGLIKIAYPPKLGRTNFSVIDNGTPALYTGTDDQGTTYYFSGNGTNMKNWVSFAGKMWRIIRINGNGSVRLLYAGDGNSANDIGTSKFNNSYDHPSYVGWKYSTAGANGRGNTMSTIYNTVSVWYNRLSVVNKSYVDLNAIYCNDRNIEIGNYSTSSSFNYGAYTRFITNKQIPQFSCDIEDQFTDGFGLMTADEVVASGGLYGNSNANAYYYLSKEGFGSITEGNWWWTMTPSYFYVGNSTNGIYSDTYVFIVNGSSNPGYMNYGWVSNSGVVRPVISLKSEVQVTGGDGSGDNPYTLTLP